jgi:capsular polysaccharide biosynthesis protein
VILSRNAASYVREVTGLIDNGIVFVDSPVRVERLIMTAKTGGMGSPLTGLTPHPADVAVLREFFAKYLEPHPCDRKLYLSRVGRKRSPANECDLQRDMEKQGFVRFEGTDVSLLSQVALFSSARKLIGLHGAAFANIVWAHEGVDVCEIFSSGYMPSCYSALTTIRAGRYTPVSYTPGAENTIDAATLERLAVIARREVGT